MCMKLPYLFSHSLIYLTRNTALMGCSPGLHSGIMQKRVNLWGLESNNSLKEGSKTTFQSFGLSEWWIMSLTAHDMAINSQVVPELNQRWSNGWLHSLNCRSGFTPWYFQHFPVFLCLVPDLRLTVLCHAGYWPCLVIRLMDDGW